MNPTQPDNLDDIRERNAVNHTRLCTPHFVDCRCDMGRALREVDRAVAAKEAAEAERDTANAENKEQQRLLFQAEDEITNVREHLSWFEADHPTHHGLHPSSGFCPTCPICELAENYERALARAESVGAELSALRAGIEAAIEFGSLRDSIDAKLAGMEDCCEREAEASSYAVNVIRDRLTAILAPRPS